MKTVKFMTQEALLAENMELQERLREVEEAIRAIRGGEVDALIVESNDKASVHHIVAEEILAQSILEQVADAVVICNEHGTILRASRAVCEFYDEDPLHKSFEEVFQLYKPGKEAKEPIQFEALAFSENLRGYEVVLCHRGEEFYLLLSVGVLRSGDNRMLGAVITLTDITARKRAEASLRQADRRKDEFLATLAHELRNPLAPLYNALNILKLGGRSELLHEAQETMSRQLQQMVRLVDDLLDVSRISRNLIELRKENIKFQTVLDSALETAHPLIQAKRHQLILNVSAPSVYLDADLTRMSQIFANLLNNAAKYTPDGGVIEVDARAEEGNLIVSIRDSGIGIEQSMLPKIFDMFSQVDRSFEKSQGGLGIGLSLVRNLLELHQGTIEARSSGLGKGTEFIVSLPIAAQAAESVNQQALQDKEKQTGLRVLVVDDNKPSAQTMGWMLELMGHQTHLVHDSNAVVSTALKFKPEVILLDIGLPGKNGYELCQELRSKPDFKHTTMIAQTGWGQEKDKHLAREAGFDHHLVKPVNAEALGKILSEVSTEPVE